MEMAAVMGMAVITSGRHLFSKVERKVLVPSRPAPLSPEVECGAMLGPQKGSLKMWGSSKDTPLTGQPGDWAWPSHKP